MTGVVTFRNVIEQSCVTSSENRMKPHSQPRDHPRKQGINTPLGQGRPLCDSHKMFDCRTLTAESVPVQSGPGKLKETRILGHPSFQPLWPSPLSAPQKSPSSVVLPLSASQHESQRITCLVQYKSIYTLLDGSIGEAQDNSNDRAPIHPFCHGWTSISLSGRRQ